jgi:hypothetical protein
VRDDHGKHYQLESFDAARRLAGPLFDAGGRSMLAKDFEAGTRGKICRNLTDIGAKTIQISCNVQVYVKG